MALTAEPQHRSPELAAHLAECRVCAAFAAELSVLDARIRQALEVPVPPVTRAAPTATGAGRPASAVARLLGSASRGWFALAAGGLIAAVIAATLFTVYPRESLAGALVDHVAHEPDSWARTDVPVSPGSLAYVLGRAHVQLEPGTPLVSYAQSCQFRGWSVPHLVVQTERGPVTVMLLTHVRVGARATFDEGGYHGVVVPAARGALAVLARDEADRGTDVEAVAARVAAAVRYLD